MPGFKKSLTSDITFTNSPFYIKYGIPVLLTILVTLIKIGLANYIGFKTPFLLYFGVVILVSRYFGEKAAIGVSVLSAIAATTFFTYPVNILSFNKSFITPTLIFLLECGLIIRVSSALSQSLKTIHENGTRFKTLVEKNSAGIVTINISGKITYCSPSIQNIIGYTDAEFLALPSWQLMHAEEALEIKEQFFRLALHPGKTAVMSHRMKHKNGEWIWIESKMINLLNEQPINAIIANFNDITERISNDKAREDFINVASHELKTPLTSLKAYTQVLISRFRNADETSYSIVNKIDHQVNRVVQMITNLLDVTMLHEKKMNLHVSPFDLNELITEVTDSLQQTSKRHQINMELAPLMNRIEADRERLGQVITNLTSNAIKYSPGAESVDISSRIENEQIIVSVTDYGIGIPKDDQNKVFERFYRVDGAKKMFQGLGLGLFICYQIIEQHQGKIGVYSDEGKGSTFWFSLPLIEA